MGPPDRLLCNGSASAFRSVGRPMPSPLEESHIVHCDLWGGNVLMKGGRPLLSGFGLATVIDDSDIGTGCKDLLRTLDISADVSRLPPETIGGWPTGPSNNVYQAATWGGAARPGILPSHRQGGGLAAQVPHARGAKATREAPEPRPSSARVAPKWRSGGAPERRAGGARVAPDLNTCKSEASILARKKNMVEPSGAHKLIHGAKAHQAKRWPALLEHVASPRNQNHALSPPHLHTHNRQHRVRGGLRARDPYVHRCGCQREGIALGRPLSEAVFVWRREFVVAAGSKRLGVRIGPHVATRQRRMTCAKRQSPSHLLPRRRLRLGPSVRVVEFLPALALQGSAPRLPLSAFGAGSMGERRAEVEARRCLRCAVRPPPVLNPVLGRWSTRARTEAARFRDADVCVCVRECFDRDEPTKRDPRVGMVAKNYSALVMTSAALPASRR